jgi:hypothetical protein
MSERPRASSKADRRLCRTDGDVETTLIYEAEFAGEIARARLADSYDPN